MTARSFPIENGLQDFVSKLSNRRARIANRSSAVVLTVCIALGISGCAQPYGGSSGPGTSAQLKVVSTTDLGTLPTNPAITGRDEGYSTAFQGFSVWLKGAGLRKSIRQPFKIELRGRFTPAVAAGLLRSAMLCEYSMDWTS